MRPDLEFDVITLSLVVSPMIVGKQMQFFGARANLCENNAYAINGGVDEKLKLQVGPVWQDHRRSSLTTMTYVAA